ncbi:hypothetical protein [Methylobacterium segetis]|uniref:hypothetical protein n=1 Tax=Methylobacterium segetis TaxID=2488750 RepID=UPI001052EF5A|nr:hypothetical protein [Methylobacterium segetis]
MRPSHQTHLAPETSERALRRIQADVAMTKARGFFELLDRARRGGRGVSGEAIPRYLAGARDALAHAENCLKAEATR